jgi:hypothetical protein
VVTKKSAPGKKATKRKQWRAARSKPDCLPLLRSLIADLDGPLDADADD